MSLLVVKILPFKAFLSSEIVAEIKKWIIRKDGISKRIVNEDVTETPHMCCWFIFHDRKVDVSCWDQLNLKTVEHSLNHKMDYGFWKQLFSPCSPLHLSLKQVNPDCICIPVSKYLFRGTHTLLHPGLFSLPWVLIISPDCRQKTNIRQNPCLKTCSLPSQFIVERYLSISWKKKGSWFS